VPAQPRRQRGREHHHADRAADEGHGLGQRAQDRPAGTRQRLSHGQVSGRGPTTRPDRGDKHRCRDRGDYHDHRGKASSLLVSVAVVAPQASLLQVEGVGGYLRLGMVVVVAGLAAAPTG